MLPALIRPIELRPGATRELPDGTRVSSDELGKARLLVDHGAAIDAIDEEYQSTPLGLAARRGQRELVEFLLTRGANPQVTGAAWATPLSWARRYRHDGIADMLRAAGATA